MKILSIDIETYSDQPLAKTGVYRYVESPLFEILLFSYSADGGPVQLVDSGHGSRAYIRIEDMGSTDIRVNPLGRDGDEGFELFLGGDCELETMIRALKFITKALEDGAKEVHD